MQNHILATSFLVCLGAQAAGAATVTTTLFTDTFDLETPEFNTALDAWTVDQGTVDVVGCAGSGGCVDLDGSTSGSLPTILRTTQSFDVVAGRSYALSFSIPTGTQADPVSFGFGSVLGATYDDYAFPLDEVIAGLAGTDGSAPIEISLGTAANNNFGPYLTRISLVETYDDGAGPGDGDGPTAPIPLPASVPLLMGGLAALGALGRRRRAG